jgi:hypothetical protein
MKKFLLASTLALALASCTAGAPQVTPQMVVDWVKANCGAVVNVADIGLLIAQQPALATTVAGIGGAVCTAINNQPPKPTAELGGPSVDVGGVVVHYSK